MDERVFVLSELTFSAIRLGHNKLRFGKYYAIEVQCEDPESHPNFHYLCKLVQSTGKTLIVNDTCAVARIPA